MHVHKHPNNTLIITENNNQKGNNFLLHYCKKVLTVLLNQQPQGRILAGVSIIEGTEKNLGKILLLERKPEDRTCALLYTLPGGKIEHKDLVGGNVMASILRGSHRETKEETGLSLSGPQKIIGHYDNDHSEIKKFRTYVTKSPGYTGTLKKFPTREHNKAIWLTPEEIVHESRVGPITTQIIKDYYGL